ncbi:MAG TPA: hypothetical protein VIV40_32875 [Kofleriaceae bacterium]
MKRLVLLLGIAACGSDPVNAEGTYTIAVTNRDNGCQFQNWTVGDSAAGIQCTINQEGENANADVTGLTRAYLDAVLGSHVFNGKISGDELDLVILGTRSATMGNCTLTVDAQLLATLNGDVLTGRINYRYHGNGNTDCAPYDGCVSYQEMNGTRPPQ